MKIKCLSKCILSILVLLTCSASSVADDSAAVVEQPTDPNMLFFTSLSKCVAGNYLEKNILSGSVGQQFLNQQIIGETAGFCVVKLTTPDNRIINCNFPMKDLANFNDPNILKGVVSSTANTTNQAVVNADELWSHIKANSCEF